MAETHPEKLPEHEGMPVAEDLVNRLFAVVMAGVMAVILLMAVASDW